MSLYLSRAPQGYRSPRGEPVEKLQQALKTRGQPISAIDGIFGGETENAVRTFQQQQNLPVTGRADEAVLTRLGLDKPTIDSLSLAVTADFEGHGYTRVAGNFDGAGLTFGIIGFTLKHGEIKALLQATDSADPGAIGRAFGLLEASLRTVLEKPLADQLDWADSISIGRRRDSVLPAWDDAFRRWGQEPAGRAAQAARVAKYATLASGLVSDLHFPTAEAKNYALCFDIAVQNGGIRAECWENINDNRVAGMPSLDLRRLVANAVADAARPLYREDVRARKLTIATGSGTVHGSAFLLDPWGLA